MHVRVIKKLLGPGVQHRQDTDGPTDIPRVASQLDDGLCRSLHEQRVAVLLVGAQHLAQLLRHGDGNVEVGAGQNLGLACGEPALCLISMALGAAPVLAGMVGVNLGAALIAAPEVSAEGFGAAGQDVGDGAPVRWQDRRAMRRQIAVRETAENVRDLDHSGCAASETAHQLVEDSLERSSRRLSEMCVAGGRRNVGVSK